MFSLRLEGLRAWQHHVGDALDRLLRDGNAVEAALALATSAGVAPRVSPLRAATGSGATLLLPSAYTGMTPHRTRSLASPNAVKTSVPKGWMVIGPSK